MLSGDFEVNRMPKEPRKLRGQEAKKASPGTRFPFLGRSEQQIQPGTITNPNPLAAPVEQFSMPLRQLNSRQIQSQAPCPVKLLVRKHFSFLKSACEGKPARILNIE